MEFREFIKQLNAEIERQNRRWQEVRGSFENDASVPTSSAAPAASPRALPNGVALRG